MPPAAPYVLAAVFAGLAIALLVLEHRPALAGRAERFALPSAERTALTQLEQQIRADNAQYAQIAGRRVTGKDDNVQLNRLQRVGLMDPYDVVRTQVKKHVAMWEKLTLHINSVVAKFKEATSGPQRDMVSSYEPGAYDDVD